MSKKKKLLWYVILGGFIVLQVFPVDKPSVSSNNPNDFIQNNDIPVEIATMLKTACYDCHSNETVFPWYSYVAPVKWLVYRDTEVGREDLNFSDWEIMSIDDQADALYEIAEEVAEGDMPMKIYPITHPDAKLSDADRKLISEWAEEFADGIYE